MKKFTLIIILSISSLFVLAQQNHILYVNQYVGNSGNNDGFSWSTAINSFADALEILNDPNRPLIYDGITEVWVSKGTYEPEYKPVNYYTDGSWASNKTKTFLLKGGIKYIGGFRGSESSPEERTDLYYNRTILSGILHSTGPVEKAYHVVIYAGDGLEPLSMDGFTIEDGAADSSHRSSEINGCIINHGYGGGIYTKVRTTTTWTHFDPIFSLKNCIVRGNQAKEGGGGMYNAGTVYYHYTDDGDKLINVYGLNRIDLTNVLMHHNKSLEINLFSYVGNGSAIFNDTGLHMMYLDHVTIADNQSAGATICYRYHKNHVPYIGAYKDIRNSIISRNTTIGSPFDDIRHHDDTEEPFSPFFSLVKGISGSPYINGYCGDCNIEGYLDPQFKNPGHASYNPANNMFPDYRLKPTSPCIRSDVYSPHIMDIDLVSHFRAIGAYSNNNTNPSVKSLDAWGVPLAEETETILTPELELVVYPVPSSNGEPLNVSLEGYTETVNLRLYSMDGRLIHDRMYEGGSFTINLPDLTSGIYIVKAHTQEGESFTKKIMINK